MTLVLMPLVLMTLVLMPLVLMPLVLMTLVSLVTPTPSVVRPRKRRCSPRRDVNASRGFGR